MLPIELEKLIVRRIDKTDNKLFHIHYIDGEPVNDVNINYMNVNKGVKDCEAKPGRKFQTSSSMLINNPSPSKQAKMLSSIIQFQVADQFYRRNKHSTPQNAA